ncbi:MAG: transporter substrate-binding domain-containing protein [Ruminococcaceae bacterium]|nr:transporter substrate-binding domain-containing protein [Oscillospiraceae bacterium]
MKKAVTLVLAALLVFSLAACGGGTSSSSSAAAGSTPASTPESTPASTPDSTVSISDEAPGGDDTATTLVLGTSADYPPFEFHILDGGEDKIVGFEVGLAYEIAADQNAELQIVDMNFDNLLSLLAKGDCDFVIAAMEATDERLEAATASDPYYTDLPAMMLVKKENLDNYATFSDFDGKTVGAQSGTTKADLIPETMPGATPLLMASVVDLVNNLVYDKCDALVLDGAVALQYAAANEELAVIEAPELALGDALPYSVWVALGDPKGLLPAINDTIARVLEDGTMDTLIADADALSSQALEG